MIQNILSCLEKKQVSWCCSKDGRKASSFPMRVTAVSSEKILSHVVGVPLHLKSVVSKHSIVIYAKVAQSWESANESTWASIIKRNFKALRDVALERSGNTKECICTVQSYRRVSRMLKITIKISARMPGLRPPSQAWTSFGRIFPSFSFASRVLG